MRRSPTVKSVMPTQTHSGPYFLVHGYSLQIYIYFLFSTIFKGRFEKKKKE